MVSLSKTIRKNLRPFLSIVILMFLGSGFFNGIKNSVFDMKDTLSSYYDSYNYFDIEMESSIGFNDSEIYELKNKIPEISQIEGMYSKDAVVKTPKNDEAVVRLHSYNLNENSLNKVKLLSGDFPKNQNEIVIEESLLKAGYKIGDNISLDTGNLLYNGTLKIVGIVESPLYIVILNKGTTNLLSGKVDYYAYLNKENVNSEVYSHVYIKLNNNKNIDQIINKIKKEINAITLIRYKDTIEEYQKLINEKEIELNAGIKKFEKEISQYEQKIADVELQLDSAYLTIPTKEEAERQIVEKRNALSPLKSNLEAAKMQLDTAKAEYNAAKQELREAQEFLNELKKGLEGGEGEEGESLIKYFESNISYAKQKLDESKVALDYSEKEYNENNDAYLKLLNELNGINVDKVIANAKVNIANKKKSLESEKKRLLDEKEKRSKQLDEYQAQLNDAKDYLQFITNKNLNINSRENSANYSQYISDVQRVDNLGNFFPIIFFVVAILMTLITITRMVEHEKTDIGILKALGYDSKSIMSKYLKYSFAASFFGSLFGGIFGVLLMPKLVSKIYSILYKIPDVIIHINFTYLLITIVICVLSTLLTTYVICKNILKQRPIVLLRNEKEEKGNKFLLENNNLFKKLSFISRINIRNTFKYKKRFLMTIIGIAGCVSLIISGFSLRNSIANIIPLQFKEIFRVDVQIFFKDSIKNTEIFNEKERINNLNEVDDSILTLIKTVSINDKSKSNVFLVIPEDNDLLNDFVTLRNNNEKFLLNKKGIIITKKLALNMDIKIGDEITLKDNNALKINAKVIAICDNYVSNYIYMDKEYYQEKLNVLPKYNSILLSTKKVKYNENDLTKKVNETGMISYLTYTSIAEGIYKQIMVTLSYIVYILVIAAIILAFIVLYNLSNLNIEERKREIATIKVLGFNKKEVNNYMENEIKCMMVIGIIIGVVFGYFFSIILIKSCELDNLMYDYSINYLNYLYSIVLTIIFTYITCLLCRKKIKKINMVESLKKVE